MPIAMPPVPSADFLARRASLRETTLERGPRSDALPLAPGDLLLRVDRFALTANNITYAVFGDAMAYWSFFPSHGEWGRVPVWGFADVERSAHAGFESGERIYGYLPMSTHLLVRPDRVTPRGFVDGAAHRAKLPPVYNQYTRVAADPADGNDREDAQMLFRPLFATSFLIDDFLADNAFFGATEVLVSSASSKTSLALAFLLGRNRSGSVRVVGLTSARNRAFVERAGCYDEVVTYDAIDALPTQGRAAFVDMAGNGSVLARVHERFRDRLAYSCLVGATHWQDRSGAQELAGPKPAFFFAPDQLRKRSAEWGPGGLETRLEESWKPFADAVSQWIEVVHRSGPDAVRDAYLEVLAGDTPPDRAYVLSLHSG
jgi:uncharacterized protein DUF2855